MASYKSLVIDCAAAGDNLLLAGVAGKNIRVHGLDLSLAQSTTLQLKHAATAFMGPMQLDAYSKPLSDFPYFVCAAGESLSVALGGAVQCSGVLWYLQD